MEMIHSPVSERNTIQFTALTLTVWGLAQTILKEPTCHNYRPSFRNPAGKSDSGSARADRTLWPPWSFFIINYSSFRFTVKNVVFKPLCPPPMSTEDITAQSQWAQPLPMSPARCEGTQIVLSTALQVTPPANCNCQGSWDPLAISLWRVFTVLLRSLYDWN